MRLLTRRDAVLASTCLALGSCVPAGVAAAAMDVTADSLVSKFYATYIARIPEFTFAGLLGNGATEAAKSLWSTGVEFVGLSSAKKQAKIDLDAVIVVAEKSNIDVSKAVNLARVVGSDEAIKYIESGYNLLVQQQQRLKNIGLPANIFSVHVRNDTNVDIGGQLIFTIVDSSTQDTEGNRFWRPSIVVPAGTARHIAYPIEFDFATAGLKEIKVFDKPRNLETKTTSAFVMPVGIKTIA